MYLFIPRSLCALKRIVAKGEHCRFAATSGVRFWTDGGMYRAEATDGRRAVIVQCLLPLDGDTPNWPGFKEVPDDASEAIILPKDLERACKLGDEYLQKTFKGVGLATRGKDVLLGLGEDCITTRSVEGRFPNINQVVPSKPPVFSVPVNPRLLADTLLALADMLPEQDQRVDLFYYGVNTPIGLCARNPESGAVIDALFVPLVIPPVPEGPQEEPEEEPQEEPEDEEPQVEDVVDDCPDDMEHVEEEIEEPQADVEDEPAQEPQDETQADPVEQDAEPPASKRRRRKTAKA